MNLVYVENVVAAVVFMLEQSSSVNGEVFIISDDDCLKNNFLFIEKLFRKSLGSSNHYVPVIPIPLNVLAFLLRILGRDIINPMIKYNPKKMLNLGFKRPFEFEESVVKFLIDEGNKTNAYSRAKSNRL
jgi:nucleoside-diphosphate-sugar epimerase